MAGVIDKTGPFTLEPALTDAVRMQLDRILASHPFRNSRRCQRLLAYVVDMSLRGRFDALKERVVGTAVFGREVDYDTNQDAVVRNAAAEVRKRLAQYYLDPAHENELRIELPSGSYIPEFRAAPATVPTVAPRRARRPLMAAVICSLALIAAAGTWYGFAASHSSELDRFWAPVISSPGPVQLCVGQSSFRYFKGPAEAKGPVPVSELLPMRDRFLYFGDAITLSRVSGYLSAKKKELKYRGALVTPYAELRGYPVVLVGAFNNQWTMRLTDGLRFSLAGGDDPGTRVVRDRQRPGEPAWKVSGLKPAWNTQEDYAIVTRVFDRDTERWVVAAGGVTHLGTMMAGDFLSNPAYFREALQSAPRDWEQKNMQIVLQTRIDGETPGPPRVLATEFW